MKTFNMVIPILMHYTVYTQIEALQAAYSHTLSNKMCRN